MSVRIGLGALRFGREGLALLALAVIASCAGGSGSSGASPPINTSPTPIVSNPGSVTTTATVATSASSVTLGPIGAGYVAKVSFPALATGSVPVGVSFTKTLPSGATQLTSVGRSPLAIGVPLTGIDYVSITPTANLSLTTSPGFQFTLPSGTTLAGGALTYVAFFDPNSSAGWVNLDGPGTVGAAGTFTFSANPVPMTLQAGLTYLFALYTATANLPPYAGGPASSPSPSASSSATVSGPGAPLAGPTTGPGGTTWGPTAVANILEFPVQSGYNGAGSTIAVVTDSSVNQSDLSAYLTYFQIPSTGRTVTTAQINGAPLNASDPLAALALETVAGLAPGANLVDVVVHPGYSAGDLAAAYSYLVGPPVIANVVVLPPPTCITGAPPNATILAAGAAAKIAFVAPAGDTGSNCAATAIAGPTYYTYYPYPASDVSVTAVGGTQSGSGTTLGSLLAQTGWNDGSGAGAGGYTTTIALPSYQSSVVPSGQTGRNYPDVAMPAVLAPVYYSGSWSSQNGTLWSAALYGALLANVDDYCGATLTNPPAVPYTTFASNAAAFLDVLQGADEYNGVRPFFSAGSGYDNVGGLGVPIGASFATTTCPGLTPLSVGRHR